MTDNFRLGSLTKFGVIIIIGLHFEDVNGTKEGLEKWVVNVWRLF